MKISKSSWHYRLLVLTRSVPGYGACTDLCTYMQTLLAVLTLLALCIISLPAYVYGWYMVTHAIGSPAWWQTAAFLLWFVWSALLGVALAIGLCCVMAFVLTRIENQRRTREPGIVAEYWKSLKDRTCALVEYVDEP